MLVMFQEDVMCDGKEPVEVGGGGADAAIIMNFWTMEGYAIGFLICAAAVAVRSILGGDEGAGSVLSGVSF